jgi:hypothetical protein
MEMTIKAGFIGPGPAAAGAMEMAPQNLEKTDSGDANGAVECRHRSNEETSEPKRGQQPGKSAVSH